MLPTLQDKIWAKVHSGSFWHCCGFFQKTCNIKNKGWTRRDYTWWILSKNFDQSFLTMDWFAIELISNASAQLFSMQYTQLFQELSNESTGFGKSMGCCNLGNIVPMDVPKCHRRKVCNPVYTLPLRILLKPWTLLFKRRYNHNGSCITYKVSRRTQKVRSYLANEDLALNHLVRTWPTFSKALLEKISES